MVIPFRWLLAGAWNVICVRLVCSLKFIVSFDMDQAVFWVQSFLQLLYLDIIHPHYCCCAVLIYLSLSFILAFPRMCVEHNFHMAWYSCHLTLTRRVSLVEQEVSTLPQHMCSPAVFVWVRVAWSLFFCACFVYRCLSFCIFSFDHCTVCSSVYGFCLPLWYLQTFLKFVVLILNSFNLRY